MYSIQMNSKQDEQIKLLEFPTELIKLILTGYDFNSNVPVVCRGELYRSSVRFAHFCNRSMVALSVAHSCLASDLLFPFN